MGFTEKVLELKKKLSGQIDEPVAATEAAQEELTIESVIAKNEALAARIEALEALNSDAKTVIEGYTAQNESILALLSDVAAELDEVKSLTASNHIPDTDESQVDKNQTQITKRSKAQIVADEMYKKAAQNNQI